MVKVVRIPLICNVTDKDGNVIDYKDVFQILWELQNETRAVKNKVIQEMWEWHGFSAYYKLIHGHYPNATERENILRYKSGIRGYLYDRFKSDTSINSGNLSCTLDCARNQFESSLKEYISGAKSIIEYKQNQPLEIHNKSIKIRNVDGEYLIDLSILNKDAAKQRNLKPTLSFKGFVKDKSTRDILNRCVDGTYKISCSRIVYDKKKKWCLNLSYGFENTQCNLDSDKILGIDLGVQKPFMASIYGSKSRLSVDGGTHSEIEVFRRRVESRRVALLKQCATCGDGSIGHGYKTRTKSANALEDKIAQFRNTVNHKYSRAIVDYAIKNGCGTIQMEKLTGITADKSRFLKNWTYYDLQQKIENKANEVGISVVYINPKYTSQRCSKCGHICKDNRPDQATFICQECGFTENADYNASQNIAIKDIDKIINETISANVK